jgi:thioredoxin
MNINYSDCFDKESLIKRLLDAKNGIVQPKVTMNTQQQQQQQETNVESSSSSTTSSTTSSNTSPSSSSTTSNTSSSSSSSSSSSKVPFDEVTVLQEVRNMKIKQLKEELSKYHVRWGTLIEKEEFVKALVEARRKAYDFSATGILVPGTVTDVTDEQFIMEQQSTTTSTPILLDVYATWCGPCKIMASELQQVAVEMYDSIRIMKLDSDKYPQLSSTLRVQGLPTLILFDGTSGQEMNRMEGAIPKQQLIQWIQDKAS